MTELLQAEFIGCRQAQSLTYSDAHDRMVWTITERFSPSRTTNEYIILACETYSLKSAFF